MSIYNDAAGTLTHPGRLIKGKAHYPVRCSPAEVEMIAYRNKMRGPEAAQHILELEKTLASARKFETEITPKKPIAPLPISPENVFGKDELKELYEADCGVNEDFRLKVKEPLHSRNQRNKSELVMDKTAIMTGLDRLAKMNNHKDMRNNAFEKRSQSITRNNYSENKEMIKKLNLQAMQMSHVPDNNWASKMHAAGTMFSNQ